MGFLNTIGDITKTAGKATLGTLGVANPALGGLGLGAYGIYKGVNNFFNNNKKQPSAQNNPLNSLTSLGLSGMQQGINSGQQAASLNKPLEQPSTVPTGKTSYSTPQYDYGNTGNDGSNFKSDTQGKTTDFFGKPYTPYTDSGSQNESQNTAPTTNPYNDRLKALQDKLNGLNEGLIGYLKPGDEERNSQAQLDALQGRLKGINASKELGLANISNQPIAMNFITGQSANLQRQAAAQAGALGAEAEPLTTRLARLQADRQQGFDAAKYQIGNAQGELERLQKEANPIEVGGNLVRLNPATGQYETIFKNPKVADEGFTLGEGQMRYDAKGNLIASGAPKTLADQNKVFEVNGQLVRMNPATGQYEAVFGSPKDNNNLNEILSPNEAQSLGLPYGTTRGQAASMGIVPRGSGGQQTPDQLRAADFASRMQSADQIINQLQNVGASTSWGGLGQYAPNILKSSDRQQLEQAQRTFVNAVLRRESGAAISPSEFNSAAQQYFPQPGDNSAVLQQKSALRTQVIRNMQNQAGGQSEGQFNQYQSQLRQGEILVQDRQGNIGAISANEFDPNKYTRMQGFNSPLNTGLKGSIQQKFPEGATGGQCGDFAHKLVQFPSVGDTLSQKRATVDRIGIPASVWRSNAKVGDVVITNENPTYGHVAVVTEILPNGFRVSESNFKQSDRVSHDRIIPFNSPKIYGAVRGSIKV